jgi:hypothetical protein
LLKKPTVFKDVFTEKDFNLLKADAKAGFKSEHAKFDLHKSRWIYSGPELKSYAEKLVPMAREFFESNTLLVSNVLTAHYFGKGKLPKHVDNNACTYTLDLCLYQNEPWDIGVTHDGQDSLYTLMPNEALAFYGNDQEHWRPDFPNPSSNQIGMVFFHFVEPDHWFFTKGKNWLQVITGQMTEEQWEARKEKG